jgi:hypothetical protein
VTAGIGSRERGSDTMSPMSDPAFRSLHALRIKGFATAQAVAEVSDLPVDEVEAHLQSLADAAHAMFHEQRALWRLSPAGREAHAEALAKEIAEAGTAPLLAEPYRRFLTLNGRLKEICGVWQLRNGEPNDHTDAHYDASAIEQLVALNVDTQPVLADIAAAYGRFAPYGTRLDDTCRRVADGETNMFTGVMCGSYHDVWMELHEDLILTQGADRAAEGSF